MALTYTDTVIITDLSDAVQQRRDSQTTGKSILKSSEKVLIEKALLEADGNKTVAAERLGMSREGLRKKLKRLEIG